MLFHNCSIWRIFYEFKAKRFKFDDCFVNLQKSRLTIFNLTNFSWIQRFKFGENCVKSNCIQIFYIFQNDFLLSYLSKLIIMCTSSKTVSNPTHGMGNTFSHVTGITDWLRLIDIWKEKFICCNIDFKSNENWNLSSKWNTCL